MEMMRRALVVCLWVGASVRCYWLYWVHEDLKPYIVGTGHIYYEEGTQIGSWTNYFSEITPPVVFALVVAGVLHCCVNWIFRGLKQSKDQL